MISELNERLKVVEQDVQKLGEALDLIIKALKILKIQEPQGLKALKP